MHFPLQSVFVAIPLLEQEKETFAQLQSFLTPYTDCLRLQNPETPHLTLQYWKELLQIEYQPVLKQAEVVASKTSPFSLHITGVEVFSDRVLYLSVAFSEELARLKKSCPWISGEKFVPHITIARIHHPERFVVHQKRIFKALKNCQFPLQVDRLRLYAKMNGVSQTPLMDFPFGLR